MAFEKLHDGVFGPPTGRSHQGEAVPVRPQQEPVAVERGELADRPRGVETTMAADIQRSRRPTP
jgi:hypothetical protein